MFRLLLGKYCTVRIVSSAQFNTPAQVSHFTLSANHMSCTFMSYILQGAAALGDALRGVTPERKFFFSVSEFTKNSGQVDKRGRTGKKVRADTLQGEGVTRE